MHRIEIFFNGLVGDLDTNSYFLIVFMAVLFLIISNMGRQDKILNAIMDKEIEDMYKISIKDQRG